MKSKSLKVCLVKSLEYAQFMGNNDHVDILRPVIDEIKTLVRSEEIDDDSIIELENNIIKKYFDDLIEEKKLLLNKLSSKRKLKELERESFVFSVISFYYKDCCN